jgi:hypothetical protein
MKIPNTYLGELSFQRGDYVRIRGSWGKIVNEPETENGRMISLGDRISDEEAEEMLKDDSLEFVMYELQDVNGDRLGKCQERSGVEACARHSSVLIRNPLIDPGVAVYFAVCWRCSLFYDSELRTPVHKASELQLARMVSA